MSKNPKVKELLISKLNSWSKLEEENILHVVSDELHIEDSIVEEIAKDLIQEMLNKANILKELKAGRVSKTS